LRPAFSMEMMARERAMWCAPRRNTSPRDKGALPVGGTDASLGNCLTMTEQAGHRPLMKHAVTFRTTP